MAVRLLKARLPTKISSTVEKTNEITKTTLDHVKRILTDHDYLKHSNLDGENNEKTPIVMAEIKEPHVDQKNVLSDMQEQSEACTSDDSKVEKSGDHANEGGIEASDLCSLLDKFEEAIGTSASILTPATSPGRSEHWSEPLSLKINAHENATDLTPPSTPPIQEQPEQKHIHNNCKPSTKTTKKGSSKVVMKTNTMNKGNDEGVKCTTVKKKNTIPPIVVAKKLGIGENPKQDDKLGDNKRKCKDTTPATIPGKKAKIQVEKIKEIDSDNTVQNSVEKSTSEESLSIENNPVVGDVVKVESLKVTGDENEAVPKSNDENCSGVCIATETKMSTVNTCIKDTKTEEVKELPNTTNCLIDATEKPLLSQANRDEQNKLHNNNNNNEIEFKVNTCETVKGNSVCQVEKSQNKERFNDSRRDDDHKSKNRDHEKTSKRKAERLKDVSKDSKKRRHRSRSTSTDEDSSDEERSNPRKSERYHESVRHSHGSKRRKEKHRRYSSRDDYDEERRHRRHDDRHNRKPWKRVRDVEHERKIDFRLGRSTIRDVAKEERRVIYAGGLPYGTTRDELWNRFRKFGPIEKITVHLRVGERDNYGFVTFLEPDDARVCIEQGNSDPKEPHFDLCFGGRRQFCGGSYVDFDSTTSHIEEMSETYGKVCDDIPEEDDFDSLLRMCQEGLGR